MGSPRAILTLLVFVGSAQLGGCREAQELPGPASAQTAPNRLGQNWGAPGVVARAGSVNVTRAEVQAVMAARRIPARAAMDALLRDSALAATIAEPQRARFKTLALARRLLETLRAEAAASPATETEVATLAEKHWLEFNRPQSNRVTHAVVVCESCADPGAARALAEGIASATAGIVDPAQFKAAAAAVATGAQKVVIEDLEPVAEDGRTVDLARRGQADENAGSLHLEFAQAAARLPAVGAQSPVVQTPSGFHVLLLTERLAELRVPASERARALTPEIRSTRAKALAEESLRQAREQWPVEVSRSVAQDTELILPRP